MDDVSVWTAFEFPVRAIEDDAVIARYTGKPYHGREFLYHTRHNDETVAWFELLRRRFPAHPLVQRFERIQKERRPWSSPAYGGNLSCVVGPLAMN